MRTFTVDVDGKPITITTGKVAKQASGSVVVQQGDTMVLVTACASRKALEGIDFMPLSVEYRERAYAAGMIPGGFFKREGKPTEKEVLSARLIDRPLRPLFPDGFSNEVQIFAWVISFDQNYDGDVLGIIGASAAVSISEIPIAGPFAGCRIGMIGGEYVFNPSIAEREESIMDIVISGDGDSINMVEGHALEISEEELLGAFDFAKDRLKKITDVQRQMIEEIGKEDMAFEPPQINEELKAKVIEMADEKVKEIILNAESKIDRNSQLDELKAEITEALEEEYEEDIHWVSPIVKELIKNFIRKRIVEDKIRPDGRKPDEIRAITCEVGVLPRAHGSALFTRGETQSLTATTLGTKLDEQMIENLEGESWKSFMLHYNFPPFSVGETRPSRGPGRREIGHGHLAETALSAVIPAEEHFPYTVRVVSDILESNGSSSMATVCAGSLAMMDAGVPIKDAVAGVANGLIMEGDNYTILSDIAGEEDHYGDMDFKIAGTKDGITAFQMDIKINAVSQEIMRDAMMRSKAGRMHILGIMNDTISESRKELSRFAPRIETLYIPKEKIGELIGPGGKNIRALQEETGTKISIEDDGRVTVASTSADGIDVAVRRISLISAEPEVGEIYNGIVKSIMPYGAFVEILPGNDGLLHISEISQKRIAKVEDVLKPGETVQVKCIAIEGGKIRLSRKVLLDENSDK